MQPASDHGVCSAQRLKRPRSAARWLMLALCVSQLALAAACAKARAETVPDGPPLAVPAPPPRVHAPVEERAATPPAAAPEPATASRPPARPPARPEPRAETPPPPVAAQPAPPPAAPAPEPREVRAVPSTAAAAEERKVRDLMARAARDLNRVDYQRLSVEGKSQYNQSKRFSEQADEALKERNFVYAVTLAEKAATLAAELAGRR